MHVPEQVLFPKGWCENSRRPLYCFKPCKVQAHGACKTHAETGAHRSAKAGATQVCCCYTKHHAKPVAETWLNKIKDKRWTGACAALC